MTAYTEYRFAFLSPAGIPAPALTKHSPEGALAKSRVDSVTVVGSRRQAAGLPELWIDSNSDNVDHSVRRQLLALHGVRRRLERRSSAGEPECRIPMAMTPAELVRELRELIAALDRRLPGVQQAGEAAIAHEAAALRARALKRIEELERVQDGRQL